MVEEVEQVVPAEEPGELVAAVDSQKAEGSHAEEEKFDPIKENGPIFVDWPQRAELALVITGRHEGYLEPCGCAGLDKMKGGMGRRHAASAVTKYHQQHDP